MRWLICALDGTSSIRMNLITKIVNIRATSFDLLMYLYKYLEIHPQE